MNYWDLIYRSAWIALVILAVTGLIYMFWPQFRQYQEYQQTEARLEEEIRLETEMIKQLKRHQLRFQHDPRFVEHIAHELGMTRTNETLFKFVDDTPGEKASP
jgi:cell division protein FtsB